MRWLLLAVLAGCGQASGNVSFSLGVSTQVAYSSLGLWLVGPNVTCAELGSTPPVTRDDVLAYALVSASGGQMEAQATRNVALLAEAFTDAAGDGTPIGRGCTDAINVQAGKTVSVDIRIQPTP